MIQTTDEKMSGSDTTEFEVTRRGYDRQQVDDRLQTIRGQLAAAEQARQDEGQRATQAEDELRSALNKMKKLERQIDESQRATAQDGFGFRVEKVLRLAEQEAAEVRSKAAREASALLERAKADAEKHRHDVEQSLIARAAKLDQEATQRQVELDGRERQIRDQLAASRDEAEQVRFTAKREADQLAQAARAKAEEIQARAEQAIRQERENAEQELHRLRTIYDGVRDEMARMHEVLTVELGHASGSRGHAGSAEAPPAPTLPGGGPQRFPAQR